MPIHGPPKPSSSGGNENSSGGPLPLSPLAPATEGVATHSIPEPITAECCTCLPVCHSCPRPQLGPGSSPFSRCSLQRFRHRLPCGHVVDALLPGESWLEGLRAPHTTTHVLPQGQGSFGCVWCIYHLAHGRLTRIQRLFGAETCSTPVLNRTQRGLCSSPSPDGVLATATKICAGGRAGGGQPPRGPRASVSFLHCQCSAGERGGGARRARVTGPRRAPGPPAASAVDCGTNSASLTWAPSVFGAARFGR